jgi:hypothetical protein
VEIFSRAEIPENKGIDSARKKQCQTIAVTQLLAHILTMSYAHRYLMREPSFDPFGEETIDDTDCVKGASTSARVVVVAFWFIVVALVAARAFYFS